MRISLIATRLYYFALYWPFERRSRFFDVRAPLVLEHTSRRIEDAMADMQSYKNHAQIVPLYHRVLALLLLSILIGSIVNLTESWGDSTRFYSASLIVALTIAVMILAFVARMFPLKAQDRAIRAEEQLRHYVLTGRLLDTRLTMRQIVALRFAPDAEFVALAQRAADQSLSPDAIKREVKQWRADTYRV
jgi:hypothetical protein